MAVVSLGNFRSSAYWVTLVVLVLITVADNVLVVVLFDDFTEVYAQFVNQGTAFVYIVVSSIILFVRWLPCCRFFRCFWDNPKDVEIEKFDDGAFQYQHSKLKQKKAPWCVLIGIGLFNGSGNFLMAISQPHTPGLTQSLLMLFGVPLVMALSAIFLKKKSSCIAVCGAALIVFGCGMSALRAVFQPDESGPVQVLWYSIMLFAIAQIFLSGEKVITFFTKQSFLLSSSCLVPLH